MSSVTIPAANTERDAAAKHFRQGRATLFVAMCGLYSGLGVHFSGCHTESAPENLLQQASAAYTAGDFENAQRLARDVLSQDDANSAARAVGIWSAVALGQLEEAEAEFLKVPEAERAEVCRMLSNTGDRLLNEGRLTQAEQHFRSILRVDPRYPQANDRLAYLLRLTGRYHQAAMLELELVRQGRMTIDLLLALAHGDNIFPNKTTARQLEKFRKESPHDPLPCVGLSRYALMTDDLIRAEELARAALERDGDLLAAHVLLGRALAASQREGELPDWNAQLPEGADADAGIWLVRGQWARAQKDWTGAARCFAEALRREPFMRPANQQMLEVLELAEADDLALIAAERNASLDELSQWIKAFHSNADNPETARRLSEWMASEGRLLESHAWKQLAKILSPSPDGNATIAPAGDALPSQAPQPQLEALIEGVRRYPLPQWSPRTEHVEE